VGGFGSYPSFIIINPIKKSMKYAFDKAESTIETFIV
jgi:hypothetical protein